MRTSKCYKNINLNVIRIYILQKQVLSKSGGTSPKDNIQRIMKRIFTNECAIRCSWKGIRNNFRIADLFLMKIIRSMYANHLFGNCEKFYIAVQFNCKFHFMFLGEITSRYAHFTESDFDSAASDWLRFAKQRKERENKTKEQNENKQ